MGFGGWGLGFGVLAPTPNPQSPIPNPQSPIPIIIIKFKFFTNLYILIIILINKN